MHSFHFNNYVVNRRALTIIEKYFEEILEDQGFISTAEGLQSFLKILPDEALRTKVKENLEKMPKNSLERWDTFVNTYQHYCKEVSNLIIITEISRVLFSWENIGSLQPLNTHGNPRNYVNLICHYCFHKNRSHGS